MAINIDRSFMNNADLNVNNCLVNLINSISPDSENETNLIKHSIYCNDSDFRTMLQTTNSEINIINLNCLNLKTRFDKLKLFLADVDINSQITCITLQGTCFDEHTDLTYYSIPGYTLISDAYRISTHCGVAIYLHNDFSYHRKFNNVSVVYESLAIEIWRSNSIGTKYLISSVYRPPTGLVEDLTLFIDEFTIFLTNVQERYQRAYICGDININLLKINENNHYNTFYENVTSHSFIPQITLPTRLSDTCDTLIDNIFTNNFLKPHKNYILSRIISDHQMTCCILPNNNISKKRQNNVIEVENVNEHNLSNLKDEIIEKNIYNRLDHNIQADPNENYEILLKILTEAKIKHIPKKNRRFNKRKDKKEKWMTDELLTQINKKNDMYVDWKTNSRSIDIYNNKKINFKTYERIVDRNIIETKKLYYHNTFQNIKNSMKKTWKTINETLGKGHNKRELPASVLHMGIQINDPVEIANVFNDYFANIGTNLNTSMHNDHENNMFKQYLQTPSTHSCTFESISENDILDIINKMDNKSSSGFDCISNKILKYIKHEISKALTVIINQMLANGIFPTSLKISKIIPLHKKGDLNSLNNYRPISLLPTLSKIFERVIYNQLYNYFTRKNLLSEQQYGFRSKHSTELAAIKLVDYITQQIDQKKTPVNVYIDLSKAFDTLNFNILLYKLHYYGVTGAAFELLKSYLTDRKQYVKYNTIESNLTYIKTGVPQGSILGPLLFSIYINDLVITSNTFKFLMYADDTTIYFNLEDFSNDNLEDDVTNELNKINTWLRQNRLSLNAEKTKCMVFHTHQKHVRPVTFSIDGEPIEQVHYFKFLGIMFDEHLTWKNHINMVTSKLSKINGILSRVKHIFPQHALLSIYNSLFLSHINYGLLLWGSQTAKVYTLQKKAIRTITGSEYLTHSEPLFKALDLLKINDLYKLRMLKFYYNLSYHKLPSYYDKYLDVINENSTHQYELRATARPPVRLPKTRLVFAESSILFQLIKLIRCTHEEYPEILKKVNEQSHTYYGFSFNITNIYLMCYKYECRNLICYKCGRL